MITGTSSGYAVYSFYRLILFEFLFQFVINSKHKHDIGYDKMMTKIYLMFFPIQANLWHCTGATVPYVLSGNLVWPPCITVYCELRSKYGVILSIQYVSQTRTCPSNKSQVADCCKRLWWCPTCRLPFSTMKGCWFLMAVYCPSFG